MADYAYVNNYQKRGKIGISREVFKQIAFLVTNKVKGASVSGKKSRLFDLYNPIQVFIRKDGHVDIKIDVAIKSKENLNSICEQIQTNVAQALEQYVEHVKTNIIVRVSSIE